MANYGLSTPFVARYIKETNSYADGFRFGKAVNTNVTPKFAEGKLYGDNEIAEHVKKFTSADVKLGTTSLPIKAASTVFGHKVDTAKNKIVYSSDDKPNYIGYGFYTHEVKDGVEEYWACIITKLMLDEPAEDFSTVGDNIELKNPSLSGTATPNDNREWRVKQAFNTEQDAIEFIMDFLNIAAE